MSKHNSDTLPRANWILVVAAGTAGIALSFCAAVAGFAIGRASATPEAVPEIIREFEEVEVTREIPVTVVTEIQVTTATTGASQTALSAEPLQPTADATSAPAPTQPASVAGRGGAGIDLTLFDEVWGLVDSHFDGEVPAGDVIVNAAIEGSLEVLEDEHTRYVPADVAAILREDSTGSVSGVGAYVRENDEGLTEVVAPIPGQPAELAGLQPGDVIIAVDGRSVTGIDYFQVIGMVRGPAGTTVELSIRRDGIDEPLEFTIVRAQFDVPVVETEILGDAATPIAYLRLTEFDQDATVELLDALDSMLALDPVGLILDLRNNPGGFLTQSIRVADVFLSQGDVAFRRNIRGLDEGYQADTGDIGESIPLVVLVNENSASASEIVAGAVQANDRGVIIGEITLGKGSVQTVFPLSDGSELRVTSGRWFTPDERSINDEGIAPDIFVELDVAVEIGSPEDTQLQRAIDYFVNGE